MAKHRTQVMLDEDLYQGLKKLPREVSVSEIINLLLKLAIEEIKLRREMTDKELREWFRKDLKRLKVQMYIKEKLEPYVDTIDDTIVIFKKDKKGKK